MLQGIATFVNNLPGTQVHHIQTVFDKGKVRLGQCRQNLISTRMTAPAVMHGEGCRIGLGHIVTGRFEQGAQFMIAHQSWLNRLVGMQLGPHADLHFQMPLQTLQQGHGLMLRDS